MLVKEAKLSLVFVVDDLVDAKQLTMHAQCMFPYTFTKRTNQAMER